MSDAEQGQAQAGDGSDVPPALPDPKQMQQQAASKRLQQTQAQVTEVVDIMRVNVDKVLERDQKLSELDQRADNLQAGASQFEAAAGKLKRKHCWKNAKMMIILGVVCVLVLAIGGVYAAQNIGGDKAADAAATAAPAAPAVPAAGDAGSAGVAGGAAGAGGTAGVAPPAGPPPA